MPWIKKGCVFHLGESANRSPHCQVPTPLIMDDRVRVYYAGRRNGMAFPAFFDLDRNDLETVLQANEQPIMNFGVAGAFDSDGIMPSCIITNKTTYLGGDEIRMYYTGWNEKTKTARYHNTIGMAVSKDGGNTFEQKFDGPLFDRDIKFPGLSVTPFVMYRNWWRMWYISGTGWTLVDGKYEPLYVIKYAESYDGIHWGREDVQCVQSNHPFEAFSNPCVLFKDGLFHMWYCYRDSKDYRDGNGSYRIGYSVSSDGIDFKRVDRQCGLELGSPDEFDSTMQAYPYVFELDGKLIMLYNGNSFGQTGIGLAVWEGKLPC